MNFFAISELVVTILKYFDMGTLQSAVTFGVAFSYSDTTFVKGAGTMWCESTIGWPDLDNSSGAGAPLEFLPVVLISPSRRSMIPACSGTSIITFFVWWLMRICSSKYRITAKASNSFVSLSADWSVTNGISASWFASGTKSPNRICDGVLDVKSIGDRNSSSPPKMLSTEFGD